MPPNVVPEVPAWTVPTLVSVAVTCDGDAATWTFEAETDAWTNNGQVLLSADGAYIERHDLYSVEAALDGTHDRLKLVLEVVPEWRDVTLGTSTVFNCETPELAGVLRVYARGSKDVADCRAFGEAPERWSTWDPEVACASTLPDTADTGT